jgi:hypothetical protein
MRRLALASLLALLLAPLAGCASSGGAARPDAAVLDGTVEDAETGEALPGVALRLTGGPATAGRLGTRTDADGRFRIDGVPAGSYTLRTEFAGYYTQEDRVTLRAGRTRTLRLTLVPATGDPSVTPDAQ